MQKKQQRLHKILNKSVNGYESYEILLCCYNVLILADLLFNCQFHELYSVIKMRPITTHPSQTCDVIKNAYEL